MRLMITTLFIAVTLLSGCGQSGPLYIEQDKGPEKAPIPATQTEKDKQKNTNNRLNDSKTSK